MSDEPIVELDELGPRALLIAAQNPRTTVQSVERKAGRRCANIPAPGTGNEVRMHSQRIPPSLLIEASRVYREALRRNGIWLYAIQAGDELGPIKIGVTQEPGVRIATLQQGNALDLRGIAAWRGIPPDEKILHEEFAHAHMRGEWFRAVPELLQSVLYLGGDFEDWQ